ncbi:hybrid-cluster NAD(P)-dependent oxidoreductase [Nocardioides sp. YIM 152588]|uniref:hybrid-cluster NAD(P)-dependent oxidoreductase n=1 Tax=Nocardioides sp. YIM 152588 TaxID=3158259 RepID=UPI0032E3D291
MTTQPTTEPTTQPTSQQAAEPAPPDLRLVPDPDVTPLGAGLLAEEAALDQQVVVRQRLAETHDLLTLVLEPTTPGPLAFRPGQYVSLAVDIDGESVERCYTISSPPTRPHLLTVTVKRVPGGRVSHYLHDRLAVGDRVRVSGPLGGFTVTDHPSSRYLLLSAGSGITPTLSTVRAMADLAALGPGGLDVVALHSARTPDDLPCRAELELLAATHPGLRVIWTCDDDAPTRPGAWTGHRGLLTAAVLAAAVPDLAEREVLVCGPAGYRDAVRAMLAALGADPARCHEESFSIDEGSAPVAPAAADGADAAPVGARVRFGRSDREVVCAPGTTVLEAARQAGVRLPSSCSSGLCGTCKSTLLEGRIDMQHQGGIRPREIAQDRFLPCCSTPDGDIVVDA